MDRVPVIVDAHVHVACADTVRYPRRPSGLGSEWWKTDGDAVDLRALLDDHGVDRAVVVHAGGLYGDDCRCAVDVVAADPDRLALVGGVDMDGPDPAGVMASLAGAGATGIRVSGVGPEEPAWLRDGRGAAVWERAGRAGVVVEATLRSDHLAPLGALCAASPGTTVVVDHGAFVHFAGNAGHPDALLGLADLPNIYVKLTTHNLVGASAAGWLGDLAGAFGGDRLCWGSDYPQTRELAYAEMRALAEEVSSGLDPADRAAFLGSAAARLWWR